MATKVKPASYLTRDRLLAVLTYARMGLDFATDQKLMKLAEEGIAMLAHIVGIEDPADITNKEDT